MSTEPDALIRKKMLFNNSLFEKEKRTDNRNMFYHNFGSVVVSQSHSMKAGTRYFSLNEYIITFLSSSQFFINEYQEVTVSSLTCFTLTLLKTFPLLMNIFTSVLILNVLV